MVSVMSEDVRYTKEAQMGHVAGCKWMGRVTMSDPRDVIKWEMISDDLRAKNRIKETQTHTDCQLGNP